MRPHRATLAAESLAGEALLGQPAAAFDRPRVEFCRIVGTRAEAEAVAALFVDMQFEAAAVPVERRRQIEHARQLRWVDFVWLSFSTLTTAGFGDVAPVTAAACAISTLESLCGILFPATLIARIASLPAVPRGNDG